MNPTTLLPALRTNTVFSLDMSNDHHIMVFNMYRINCYPWELQKGIKRAKFTPVSKSLHFISIYLSVRYLKIDINVGIC